MSGAASRVILYCGLRPPLFSIRAEKAPLCLSRKGVFGDEVTVYLQTNRVYV